MTDRRFFYGLIAFFFFNYIISLGGVYIIEAEFYNLYYFAFIHISSFLIIFLIYKCKSVSNSVPRIDDNVAIINDFKVCARCKYYKPERTHHCSTCNKCILKMDHHCVWLDSCIGSNNLANFVRLAFFVCLYFFISFLYVLFAYKNSAFYGTFFNDKYLSSLIIINCALSGIFIFFFIFHFYGILRNMTYIERSQYKQLLKRGFAIDWTPYDVGIINNLRSLMGYPFLFYMYGENCDGVNFDKTYFIYEWPPVTRRTGKNL